VLLSVLRVSILGTLLKDDSLIKADYTT
jgi:hypothetical protein